VRNLLFVDDEFQTLELLDDLYSPGNAVLTALNGEKALEILRKQSIDVVIIDILLAEAENGYSLAQRVQQEFPSLKIGLMTSLDKEAAKENYGADFIILSKLDLVLSANGSGESDALTSFLSASISQGANGIKL
jgi:DNA-binding NarL/FixJ family response regulator